MRSTPIEQENTFTRPARAEMSACSTPLAHRRIEANAQIAAHPLAYESPRRSERPDRGTSPSTVPSREARETGEPGAETWGLGIGTARFEVSGGITAATRGAARREVDAGDRRGGCGSWGRAAPAESRGHTGLPESHRNR